MKTRIENWGAWVRLGDEAPRAPVDLRGALVAFDRDGARALGLDGGAQWTEGGSTASAPLEAHVAVTERCAAGCTGCYQNAVPHGAHVSRASLAKTLSDLAAEGVFTVAFGGGEPLEREDLSELAHEARAFGLVPVVTTSGLGLTAARAASLRAFAQVNVSYDGAREDYRDVRGYDGAGHAERAIRLLADAGVKVGVNVVLTRATFPHLRTTLHRARDCGATEAQLLRYKPAGRAASLDYLARRLDANQVATFATTLRSLWTEMGARDMALRIDCALVCFLSADAELASDPSRFVRAGVFGCEAAGMLEAVRTDGKRAPCSFARAPDHDREGLAEFVAQPPEPCASCSLRTVCRGGCRVVAGHYLDPTSDAPFAFEPDPECPRVRSARAR